jgi:pSer/pThr/pTyr-binding forkhead associated (FHA) protein/anti-anti-sigma regulatory factor
MLRIIIERGGEVLHDRTFQQALITLGRGEENDVVLPGETVSSSHLLVKAEEENGWFRIFDQSENGTFWQGERIDALRFDGPMTLALSGYQVTLIPMRKSGTVETSSDEMFRTTLSDPLSEGAAPTAEYSQYRPEMAKTGPAELRTMTRAGELKSLVFEGAATVGRAADCDLRFDSREVSRRHCVLTASEGGYTIRRLSEKNRLSVNDHEIPRGAALLLRDGDVIRFCGEETLFLYPATREPGEALSIPAEGNPNLDLAVTRRPCADDSVAAFEMVGFLGAKTLPKFEKELRPHFATTRRILIDLGYLVGLDGAGLSSIGRILKEAAESGVAIQIIGVTPRIADLLSFSALKQIVSEYIAPSEEEALRNLQST